MSGKRAAQAASREAAVLAVGAAATLWSLATIWHWSVPDVGLGLRSVPVVETNRDGPVRVRPEDPGGAEVPNVNRELQLAITAPDPVSVWRDSRVIEPEPEFLPPDPARKAAMPDRPLSPEVASGPLVPVLPSTADGSAPLSREAAAGRPAPNATSSPKSLVAPEDSGGWIRPLPDLAEPASAGGTASVQRLVPRLFLHPPVPRPGT